MLTSAAHAAASAAGLGAAAASAGAEASRGLSLTVPKGGKNRYKANRARGRAVRANSARITLGNSPLLRERLTTFLTSIFIKGHSLI